MAKQVHVRLDDAVYEALSEYNLETNSTVQDSIASAIMMFLKQQNKERKIGNADFKFIDLFAGIGGMRIANEQEKKLVQLRKKWGKKQEKRTAREKKEKLEACLRRKAGESFCVDAITWNDLDLDAVFDTVDHTVSVCGEEYLYTALRMPVTTTEIREERERLMKLFAENQKAREAVQKALLLMEKEKMNPPTEEPRKSRGFRM